MRFSGFRIRSAKRDGEIDQTRFARLSQIVTKLAEEIQKEREGLERRFSDARMSAAFAQSTFENEGDPEVLSKADELTASMMRYESRINALENQVEFMSSLKDTLNKFIDSTIQRQ